MGTNIRVKKLDKFIEDNPDFLKNFSGSNRDLAILFDVAETTISVRRSGSYVKPKNLKKKTIDTQKVPKKHIEVRDLTVNHPIHLEYKPYWEGQEELVGQRPIQGVKFEKNKVGYLG